MSVFYKFKAWKEPATIAFDGTGISAWDLKKEIVLANNLASSAKEFDLHIFNSQTDDEYNDQAIIPRATTVIAQRLPAKKHGRGTAQYYVPSDNAQEGSRNAGRASASTQNQWRGPMSKRFDQHDNVKSESTVDSITGVQADVDNDEASRIAQMFAQSDQQWEQQQDKMATAKRVARPGAPSGGAGTYRPQQPAPSNRPPPVGYICYRCGKAGHWIQECPTNEDSTFDNKPRIKRTTGIPKSFLQSVEGPTDNQSGLMVGSDGNYVIARPDSASWAQHRSAAPKNLTAAEVQALQPQDPDLTCSIDNKLLREAVTTPCCSTPFCHECISDYLRANASLCPECESKIKNTSLLKPDLERRKRVSEYVEEMVRSSKESAPDGEDGEKLPNDTIEDAEDGQRAETRSNDDSSLLQPPSTTMRRQESGQSGQSEEATGATSRASTPAAAASQPQQMMNPGMLQQQIMQCMMMLSNPQLPPPARMQLTYQLQQAQMILGSMMQGNKQQNSSSAGDSRGRSNPFFSNQPGGQNSGMSGSQQQGMGGKRSRGEDTDEDRDEKRNRHA